MSTKRKVGDGRKIITRSVTNMNTTSLALHHNNSPSVISSSSSSLSYLCPLQTSHMHLVDDLNATLTEALRLLQNQQQEVTGNSGSEARISSSEFPRRKVNSIQEQLLEAHKDEKPRKVKAATYTGYQHSYSSLGEYQGSPKSGRKGKNGWCSEDDEDEYDADFDSDDDDEFDEKCFYQKGLKKIHVQKYVEPHDWKDGQKKKKSEYYSEPHYGGKIRVGFRVGGIGLAKGGPSYSAKGPVTHTAYVYVLEPVKNGNWHRKSYSKSSSGYGYKSEGKRRHRKRKKSMKQQHHHKINGVGGANYEYPHDKESYGKGGGGSKYYYKNGYKSFNGMQPRMNVAGILGYTLFCINYLLLMQQQPYHSHKKSSLHHHNHGDHYGAASHWPAYSGFPLGGPVMLAHCGELPASSPALPAHHLMKMHSISKPSSHLDKLESAPSTEVQSLAVVNVTTQLIGANQPSNSTGVGGRITLLGGVFPGSNLEPLRPDVRVANINEPPIAIELPVEPRFQLVTTRRFRRPMSARLEIERLERTGERMRLIVSRERNSGDRLMLVRTRDNGGPGAQVRPVKMSLRVVNSRRGSSYVITRNLPVDELNQPPQRITVQVRGERLTAASNSTQLTSQNPSDQMQNDQPAASGGRTNNNQLIDLPEFALEGDSIELSCLHGIAVDRLYSVKWFKDSMEFYRFIPANGPLASKRSLRLPDVRVDLSRSSATSVYLRNVTHRTTGHFRCEAISEGPNFETLSGEKRMQVYTLPKSGPKLSMIDPEENPFEAGLFSLPLARNIAADPSTRGPLITCSSEPASPAAYLRVLVNEKPLDPRRLLSNVTRSFSDLDELEVNRVVFRLRLDDFVISSATAPTGSGGGPNSNNELTRQRSQASGTENSNARVQFDDQLLPRGARFSSSVEERQLNELSREFEKRRQRRQAGAQLPVVEEEPAEDAEEANINVVGRLVGAVVGSASEPVDRGQSREPYLGGVQGGARGKRQADVEGGSSGRIYSNNIKIKCTSLVPAIGYDMTAELNASLTLIVPAAYLTDATAALSSGELERARGGQQLGKEVISEPRMAQASAPPAKILVAPPTATLNGTNPRQETKSSLSSGSNNNNNNNKGSTRNRGATRTASTPGKDPSKKLEKLSSNSKPSDLSQPAAYKTEVSIGKPE